MKIIIDFDDTILNTHHLLKEIVKIFERAGFSEEQFEEVYKESRKRVGNFDKKIMFDLFSSLKDFDRTKTENEINFLLDKINNFVYSDFFDFASHFDKKDLILLSFGATIGEPIFQKLKIKKSGVSSFFEKVIIASQDKFWEIEPIYKKYSKENIFFIDDKAGQIDKVKINLPKVIAIKIERPQGWHINTKSELADYIIKDLNEAKNICETININLE